ncbi:uncharacterized protein NEMAJ01_1351 [Nematocida major]|uniref:uncharacterized protein n=1 Tax=Nematocida major TaxID=1912982 RepID=UPI0020086287|nr:uncharacterized protein NEMAJ01_1351 [Nematocida major]KAH9386455.1 hypothetical protein NEMAJ01_1351 [Nematocida major]
MERNFIGDAPREYTQERIPEMDKNLRFYLKKEIRNYTDMHPDEIIAKIEAISQENIPNPREELQNMLQPELGERAQTFVNRLFGYQKRMCRDNGHCRRPGCYFKHTPVGLPMMEIDERPAFNPREERHLNTPKAIQDKQRRIVEILSKRADLPADVRSLIDQLRRLICRGRPMHSASGTEASTRFIINNRQDWMTNEHLHTYPGVVNVFENGVIECATRQDAERVFNIIYKIDKNSQPMWVE